jgi:hypothetical protein
LIIEEAAKILEAHILFNLPPSVELLILIADHKQLHPKVDLFRLLKTAASGIDFDVSLFERLACSARSNMSPLLVHHRMRPEIS